LQLQPLQEEAMDQMTISDMPLEVLEHYYNFTLMRSVGRESNLALAIESPGPLNPDNEFIRLRQQAYRRLKNLRDGIVISAEGDLVPYPPIAA
jgi:hypothetical protein